jgi:hypothetical protein|tara:strand:- start:54 stop:227 length:174 start_codon:yes stop_codon:yes gene_type:complete
MMELSEGIVGLLGVAGLFSLIIVWCWLEGKREVRRQRKCDKQQAVYDKWMRERVKGQ